MDKMTEKIEQMTKRAKDIKRRANHAFKLDAVARLKELSSIAAIAQEMIDIGEGY